MCRPFYQRRAITLIELLVVIAIIGVLIALLLPAVQKARMSSLRTQCESQMRQLGIALFTAQDIFGTMPPYAGAPNAYPLEVGGVNFTGQYSFYFYLLPFVDQGNLCLLWSNAGLPNSNSSGNGVIGNSIPPPRIFLCPADASGVNYNGLDSTNGNLAVTNYVVNFQVFYQKFPKVPTSFPDGASSTGLLYERYGDCGPLTGATGSPQNSHRTPVIWATTNGGNDPNGPWAYSADSTSTKGISHLFPVFQNSPPPSACDNTNTQGMHNGENVLLGDGSVHLVNPNVSETSWNAAITPDGGDIVNGDF
jgi:prepilin-type N-terminal cleavage/methylation domain-containing protein